MYNISNFLSVKYVLISIPFLSIDKKKYKL